ncbi:MAG: hypothetical protein WBO69_12460, partial [Thermoanaerobaculia bacterium]
MNRLLQSSLVVVCAGYLAVAAKAATDSSGVDDLLDRAEALLRLGVAEKGASRAFEESLDLVEIA